MPGRKRPAALVWMRDRDHGVRPVLSEERIVRAAVELADAEGIDALSMRRIAAALGSGTTSVYRHITGKDELIELMIDAVHGEQPLPPEPGADWRAGLADVARGYRALLLRHPWLAVQASRRAALGPNVIARGDHALGVVDRFTRDATRAHLIVSAVNTYVLGSVATELADREAYRATGMTEREWQAAVGSYVRHVVESGSYPHFNRRVIEADEPDAQARFEFGLDCLLSGIASGAGDPGSG